MILETCDSNLGSATSLHHDEPKGRALFVVPFPNPGQILFHSISNTTQGKGNGQCDKSQGTRCVLCITPLHVTLLQFFLGKTDNGYCVRKKFVQY